MQRTFMLVTLPVCVAIVAAGVLLARAGNLDPPPGPVTPTMVTLDQVYNAVAASNGCPPCVWEYKAITALGTAQELVAAGQGVVHGFWVSSISSGYISVQLSNGPAETDIIGEFRSPVYGNGGTRDPFFIQLDTAFDAGLYIKALQGTPSVTVLYRFTP